jgi:hypothetical protein
MFKFFLFSLAALFTILNVHATQNSSSHLSCSGEVQLDGAFVDLDCTNGYCTGWLPKKVLQINGNCENGIVFEASGEVQENFVTGFCKGGVVSSTAFSQNLSLYGDCSFQDIFYGSFYSLVDSPVGSASGFCQENGMSRIFFNGGKKTIFGHCRK